MGVMGHIDDDDAYPIVRQLLRGLPAGSFLALQDGAEMSDAFSEAQEDYDDAVSGAPATQPCQSCRLRLTA